jgi:hypothetical protein
LRRRVPGVMAVRRANGLAPVFDNRAIRQ